MRQLFTTTFGRRTTAAEVLAGLDLTGRRYLVTGGASGIGLETARALTGAGAEVTVVTRTPTGGERALDLSDLDAVRAFTSGWTGPLHGIVANAGIMALPTRQVTGYGWELHLATNFLGHFALITGLHDALREAGDARVVVLSSGIQVKAPFDFDDPQFERRPYQPWAAYGQSKVADALLAVGISRRWADDGIVANIADPGYVHTRLQRHLDESAFDGLPADLFSTTQEAAATSVLLAASPLTAGVTGRYFLYNQEVPVVAGGPDATSGVAGWSLDPVAADRLWDYAAAAAGGPGGIRRL